MNKQQLGFSDSDAQRYYKIMVSRGKSAKEAGFLASSARMLTSGCDDEEDDGDRQFTEGEQDESVDQL